MREIEIKATISSVQSVIDRLATRGVTVTSPVKQRDRVYGQIGVDGATENSAPWLRIRTETKNGTTKHIFTLKRSITNQLDSIEHETVVEDAIESENIVTQLGFELYSDLTKTRQKAVIGDVEICLDTVENLGTFIEAEKLTADEVEYEVIVVELWTILESIGVKRDDEVRDGYDVLMNKKLALAEI